MHALATITIDGKKVKSAIGANLLQIARENGFDIPGLCYHKKISPTGACRLCMVKVAGTKGFVMSCTWAAKTHGKALDDKTLRESTCGNLCRCGTYPHIVSAALEAAGATSERGK